MKCKKIFGLLLAIVTVAAMAVLSVCANEPSVFKRGKQSIFLVIDDSSSMDDIYGSQYDANYALQTIIAMTDKDDDLKVYFLNKKDKIGDINMSSKSTELIKNIASKYPAANGGTPYQVVKDAQLDLINAVKKDDDTEYCLVIFTDGGFGNLPVGVTSSDDDLKTFAKTELANGTKPKVMAVTINGVEIVSEDETKPNITSIQEDTVLAAMNKAAVEISGRVQVEKAEYSQGDTVVTFDIPYPAYNIIVFTQNQSVSIENYTSGSELNIDENYTVSHPLQKGITDSTVCFVTEKNGSSIQHGTTSLTFNKAVIPNDTVILIEPAIGITAEFYNQDGALVKPEDFQVGETIKVKYYVCDSETKKELPEAMFSDKITYSGKTDNNEPKTANEFEFKVESDTLAIELQATLPDGYTLEYKKEYRDLKPLRVIAFALSGGGMFKADYDKLDDADGVVASLLVNGSPADIKDFNLKVKGENFFISNFDIEPDYNNNNFVIHPKKGLIGVLTPKKQTYEVVLTDNENGKTYTQTMTVEIPGERPWIDLVKFLLLVLAILYVIIVLATKVYFPLGKHLVLYINPKLKPGQVLTYDEAFSFSKLMWREFLQIFSGKFSFFKHFFKQFLPCQSLSVTLYGIGCPGEGEYSDITISAKRSGAYLIIDDKTLTPKTAGGGYSSDYTLIAKDFMTSLAFNHLQKTGKSDRVRYEIGVGQILKKTTKNARGGKYSYYLQFTNK